MEKIQNEEKDVVTTEILKLVARGSAILSELLRLKDFIPDAYFRPSEVEKYRHIMFDFSFFDNPDKYLSKILNDQQIREQDEDFREANIDILERFFFLFRSIFQYYSDWEVYIEQVNQGIFVQHTFESLLQEKQTKVLLCESLFNFGIMMLLLDRLIPGSVREKIIMSYYRYKGQSTIPNFSEIMKFFRKSGFISTENKPKKYPCELFGRMNANKEVVKKIIGVIKDGDIYDQVNAYPSPDHRSHALSSQATMIFVLLFFVPEYLESEKSKMREIVDKHFSDNWVISLYMGYTVDILDYYKDFSAAKIAINITIESDSVRYYTKANIECLEKVIKVIDKQSTQLQEAYVLDNVNKLINTLRQANVTLRWLLLQRTTTNEKYASIINRKLNPKALVNLLLKTSHFEFILKGMFEKLIEKKETLWETDKKHCLDRMSELAEYFAGNINFGHQVKDEGFEEFFKQHVENMNNLSYNNSISAGRNITLVKESIENAKMYHYAQQNLQIKQYLSEITDHLSHMLRTINVKKQVLLYIAQISDFSYGWKVIQTYGSTLQQFIKEDSNSVLLLRSTFLKLASIMNFPLVRIIEADSPDFESVSKYYSDQLVRFVKTVLQIIPLSVFSIHDRIINILSKGFNEMPQKIPKSSLKEYAQLDLRYQLSKATHEISLYTKAILMMKKTLVGVIEVDPKNILEEGIRQELLILLSNTYQRMFSFEKTVDFEDKLSEGAKTVDSIKKSFVYIQDYINTDGSRLWNEETSRLINYLVSIEANRFLKKKIKINSEKYKIPTFKPVDSDEGMNLTFIGRVADLIINIKKNKYVYFYPTACCFFNVYYKKKVFTLRHFYLLRECLGSNGIQGLNRYFDCRMLFSFDKLENKAKKIVAEAGLNKSLMNIEEATKRIDVLESSSKAHWDKQHKEVLYSGRKLSNALLEYIEEIGTLAVIKDFLTRMLRESAQTEGKILVDTIESIDKLVTESLSKGNLEFDSNKVTDMEAFLRETATLTESVGLEKWSRYKNMNNVPRIVLLLGCTTIYQMVTSFVWEGGSLQRTAEGFDVDIFARGVLLILAQTGKPAVDEYVAFLLHYIKSYLVTFYSVVDFYALTDYPPKFHSKVAAVQFFLSLLVSRGLVDIEKVHNVANPTLVVNPDF